MCRKDRPETDTHQPQLRGGNALKLDFKTLNIKGLEWGKKTTVSDGVLYINPIEAVVACGTHPLY